MNKNDYIPLPVSTAANAPTERIKELNCLYGISSLFKNQDVSLSWIMHRAVELIPTAWQYPKMHARESFWMDWSILQKISR